MDRPTRLITLQDAAVLADLLSANRKFLAPWEPVRADEYFTADGQRGVIRGILQEHRQGMCLPHVILNGAGEVAGRITLNSIVRGAFQSCSMGYWVDAGHNGRGLATAAVRSLALTAFEDLGLHRVQAEILPHNAASKRVLERNGFARYGTAPSYLRIAGRWQDHDLYQLLAAETAQVLPPS
jgi:ribosomal-protein-alanine N-acetyltransferase